MSRNWKRSAPASSPISPMPKGRWRRPPPPIAPWLAATQACSSPTTRRPPRCQQIAASLSPRPRRTIPCCFVSAASSKRPPPASTRRAPNARPALDLAAGYGRGTRLDRGDVSGFDAAAFAGLQLRVPLLTGGLVPSRIRQAQAIYRAERFDADAAEREAVRAADAAWASLVAARTRLQANIDGLAAADLALQGVRAEYGFGLRSTIDILVADQSFRSAQLGVASARSDVLTAQAAVLRATGRLRPDAFL